MPSHTTQNVFVPARVVPVAAIVLVVSAALSLAFLYQVESQPLVFRASSASSANSDSATNVAPGQAALSAQAAAAFVSPDQPIAEIHIANNGQVLLRGARVVSVAPNSIQVTLSFDAASFDWTLGIDANTKFPAPGGSVGSLSDIHVGDTVTATGMLSNTSSGSSIEAQFVRKQ